MGAGAAGVHIPMTTLPMAWFEKQRLGRALGIIQGGTGLGILVTGFLLPPLLISMGREAWRNCWLLMAVHHLCGLHRRDYSAEGKTRVRAISPPLNGGSTRRRVPCPKMKREMSLRTIILVYFIFGFAYNIYATYFVAFMVEEVRLARKRPQEISGLSSGG